MSVEVFIQPTPNPNALKFILDKDVKECIGCCKNDMTLELWECYEECLNNYKGFVEKLEEVN